VNVVKSILELFLSLCDYHEKAERPFPSWGCSEAVTLSAEKMADKKLSPLSKAVLTAFCVVQAPHVVLSTAVDVIKNVKAPVAHEEFLKWFKAFCNEFGAASIGPGIKDTVTWLLEVRPSVIHFLCVNDAGLTQA
jgi:hypothetical protein